ncbi:hypothetical protein GOBAR_AA21388 [Gossypium barbadense]|uniref:HAUS augmin-like complex subunit 6 N-terminal domain-containing protein n=1 Tax=Gossypium barbadense TaxID=3634 RepID=A0A2P5X7H2_GOSBA|nr:hypothetical protein GOBAR_AA21388 [Gossypium barbadense]
MYTNCLLLGLDPPIIGLGASNVTPRVGLFRHSNPKLGEQLLYFILSSLRGPAQSASDFDRVWPIFDSAQSRDFRKVVQGIISELEAEGALPRSNSRVSSLATCCGPRFVELLWQLSLHALREVYRRNFAADVASNTLPVPLTDVAFSHAATLLPARISLERRRFLKNAETTVQRQAMWSNLAHEMIAEFRGLCAEEAYLQQEQEKLHDLRNKVKLEGELWDDLVSTSSQNSHLANANDGEGPDILRSAQDGSTSGHAESLATSLAEHQQHLASFQYISKAQVLINQLKEVAPAIQKSISNCTEKVNGISSNLPSMVKHHSQATSPIQAQSSGRTLESSSDDVGDITPKMSKVQLDKISPSSPALKLPQLFSLSPNSLVKSGNMQKQHTLAPQTNQIETLSESSSLDQPLANNGLDNPPQDTNDSFVQNLKRSVRQAALSVPSHDSESSRDSQSDESSEHFFVPISSFNFYHGGPENKVGSIRSKKLFSTQKDNSLLDSRASDGRIRSNYDDIMLNKLDSLNDYDPVNVFLSAAASSTSASDGQRSFFDLEEAQDVFSPSFLMDASLLSDSYEDLLDISTCWAICLA